ncbi:MAG: sialate O-acetylesterase [Akkermansiaceae bacterium]|jgi:putative membrane-bound dehydrogenase-like protein
MKKMRSTMLLIGMMWIAIQRPAVAVDLGERPVKLFLLGGQSNMDGCGLGEELPAMFRSHPKNVVTWDNQKKLWVELTKDSMATARRQQFGPEMAFAHRLAKTYPNHTIALVKTSAGGTKLHTQWVPGKGMYERFIGNFRNASTQLKDAGLAYEVAGMLWMQGESDSGTVEMAKAYEENLKLLVADVRKQTGNTRLPFVMGRISSSLLKKTPWNFDQAKTVQAAQEAVAGQDEHVHIINTDQLSTREDNTHFDSKAQLTLGGQMAGIMIRVLENEKKLPKKANYLRPEINGPVLDPVEAISKMHVADGFELNLFAAEPRVINPVVMRFDHLGRLWVVEMVGYMNDLNGTKELQKLGRISILEDTTGDGKMNQSKVFLEGLVEPRAIAFHKEGILWADDQKLYYTVVGPDDEAGRTVVVDEGYSTGHSVEHKPNGLVRAIDNWYYNAKSDYRYQEVDGEWLIERTEFRGQFGMSADNHGRLYHGQQNTLMRAEVFSPNFFLRNANLDLRMSQLATEYNEIQPNCFNIKSCEQPVFPVRRSRDIRDGYHEALDCDIDEGGFAFRCTAACGQFFYRGNQFGEGINAFVADPGMHFVKAIKIRREEGIPFGQNVYADQEMVASPDTRFRPVDLQSAPDGSLYIADMYHGINQHRFFMSAHLRAFIEKNHLETPPDLGRIYRLSAKHKKPTAWKPFHNPGVIELAEALTSDNPWMRDTAQRILVDRKPAGAKEAIESVYRKSPSSLGKIHALWTLEGIGEVAEEHVLQALGEKDRDLAMHAARLSWRLENSDALMRALIEATPETFDGSSYYLFQRLANFSQSEAQEFLVEAYLKWGEKPFVIPTLLSGFGDHLESWISGISDPKKQGAIREVYLGSKKVSRDLPPELQDDYLQSYHRGKKIYLVNCFSCHGKDGRGLLDMGPPLAKSDWVTGEPDIITKIVLKGMQGAIEVSGKKYQPKIPMLAFESIMTDEQIADVSTYIRNSWGNKASPVDGKSVRKIRGEISKRETHFQESDFRSE